MEKSYLVWEIPAGVISSQHQAKTTCRYTKQKNPQKLNQNKLTKKPNKPAVVKKKRLWSVTLEFPIKSIICII